jgi:hypothetical protein
MSSVPPGQQIKIGRKQVSSRADAVGSIEAAVRSFQPDPSLKNNAVEYNRQLRTESSKLYSIFV